MCPGGLGTHGKCSAPYSPQDPSEKNLHPLPSGHSEQHEQITTGNDQRLFLSRRSGAIAHNVFRPQRRSMSACTKSATRPEIAGPFTISASTPLFIKYRLLTILDHPCCSTSVTASRIFSQKSTQKTKLTQRVSKLCGMAVASSLCYQK